MTKELDTGTQLEPAPEQAAVAGELEACITDMINTRARWLEERVERQLEAWKQEA